VTPQQAAEARALARMRTLEFLAAGRLASLADNNPQRPLLQRKLRDVSSRIRTMERVFEDKQ
jgi:hypothetical protein